MNTNNKEAIELLESIEKITNQASVAELALRVRVFLQDNEDTEVEDRPTFSCSNCKSNSHITLICDKPSSKVEKLKELREALEKDRIHPVGGLYELIDILIEDEE